VNVNIQGGVADWTAMAALVQSISFTVKTGGIHYELQLGPNKVLSVQNIAQRMRAARQNYVTPFFFQPSPQLPAIQHPHQDAAEETGGGIEQAAGRRRDRGVEPAGELDADDLDLARIQAVQEGSGQLRVDPIRDGGFGPGGVSGAGFRSERLGRQQVAQGHAVRLLDRQGTAGHRGPPEASHAAIAGQRSHEHFPTPERSVVAHAEAVEGDADELADKTRFGRGRRNVGVVMLDTDLPALREVARRVLRGEVPG